MLNETKELIKVRDHLYNKLAKHTGQPVEKVSFMLFIRLNK